MPLGRLDHPDVARLDDGGAARGQVGEERAFLDELVQELLAVLLRKAAQRREHLQRHGALPDHVHGPIDGRKTALADDALDGVFLGDRPTDELQRVAFGHKSLPPARWDDTQIHLRAARTIGFMPGGLASRPPSSLNDHSRLSGPLLRSRRGSGGPSSERSLSGSAASLLLLLFLLLLLRGELRLVFLFALFDSLGHVDTSSMSKTIVRAGTLQGHDSCKHPTVSHESRDMRDRRSPPDSASSVSRINPISFASSTPADDAMWRRALSSDGSRP